MFIKSPQNITATKGQLVVFECRIRASTPLQVRWYRECNQIIDSADFRILRKKACSSMVPEEVCSLVITEAFPEDSGIYICIAENDLGAIASSAFLWVPEVSAIEEIGNFESAPLLTDMLTNMNISSAPDSQFVAMGKEAENNVSDASGRNASDPANEVEHESSQCQNYSNQSISFPGINENPSGNSHDWRCTSRESPAHYEGTDSLKGRRWRVACARLRHGPGGFD
ncbi:myotilin [Crotalus adamanteus]|uniref:Myotilin n=1 Tax=Crotalus adamanteus TaxID=8729 RepID=A0AAW1BWJ9_CROAD